MCAFCRSARKTGQWYRYTPYEMRPRWRIGPNASNHATGPAGRIAAVISTAEMTAYTVNPP